MENQSIQGIGEMEYDEFPDEFQCCVCLDIMYKPVVLACGHISCFWCVFKAMDSFQESHCPVCRNPYNNFPRICKLLHSLLLKLYPSAYERREKQVAEEEKYRGTASPQFADDLLDSPSPSEVDVTALPTTSTSQTTNEVNSMVKHEDTNGICKQVSMTDFECSLCKQLLCRPLVLNCGHVYCEACINKPQESVCTCPLCQSPHPNGFPNVCLVLEHYLEKQFPEEYSARKESSPKLQNTSTSGSIQKEERSPVHANVYSSWLSGQGPKFHPNAGCDYCGMYPIIGERYRCKDCVEKIGFDLCEACYKSSSKLPGRFNQQHTQDHQFVIEPPPFFRNIILSLGAEDSEGYDVTIVNPDNLEEQVFTIHENAPSINSSGGDNNNRDQDANDDDDANGNSEN